MVLLTKCSFCAKEVSKGTGKLYVKSDGTIFLFCSSKCENNMIKLKREPKKVRWTGSFERKKVAHSKK